MGAFLALMSSVCWGSGDFIGGTFSRRIHPLAVLQTSQGFAVIGLLVIAVATHSFGDSGYLGWGVAGGLVGLGSLGCFYRALAEGTMGVVAPVAAMGVVVPVGIGLAHGDSPHVVQLVGIVVAIVGVVLASGPEPAHGRGREVRPLVLSAIAAVGFGATLVLVADGAKHSVIMTLLTMRITNVVVGTAVLAAVARTAARPDRRDLPALAASGTLDAGANGMFAVATHTGALSLTSVFASLYPAVTVLLAWRFHHEKLRRVQVVGVVTVLVGVACIAGGGST